MAILRYILSVLTAVLLTGCYEDFIPETDTTPVLCLNSLIIAGEPIDVQVTRTWVFTDEETAKNNTVPDAVITIFANERIVGCDYLPQEGDRIRVEAESALYGKATAEVTVPHATPIGMVKSTPSVTSVCKDGNISSGSAMHASVTFNLAVEMDINDPAATVDYYHFYYNWSSPAYADDCPTFNVGDFEYDAEPIFKEHVGVFETVMGNGEDISFAFFTDRQFSGRTYPLHLNFTGNTFNIETEAFHDSMLECEITLYLNSVSESYYNWAVYRWNANEGIAGDLADIGLAEAKWGYSNVSTGAGVVAAQASAKYTVSLKEFLENAINGR